MAEPGPEQNGLDGSREQKETDDQKEEKERIIAEILELQNTLHDLSQRVHSVREENDRLHTDNKVRLQYFQRARLRNVPLTIALTLNLLQVLDQYIANLMDGSDIFRPAHK